MIFLTCDPNLTRKWRPNSTSSVAQEIPALKRKVILKKDKRPPSPLPPRPISKGTCERFRGAVLSSVGTWSRVTYRALVANAVITKQSCSRAKKKEIYKDKRANENEGQGFPNLRSLSSFFGGCIFLFQSHVLSRNSPVWCYDCVSMLKLSSQTTVTTCTYMRPHNQSFSRRSKSIISVGTGSGSIQQKEQMVEGTSASDLVRCFIGEDEEQKC